MEENMNENVPVEPAAEVVNEKANSGGMAKVIITSVLCTILVVCLVIAVLLWSGVFDKNDEPVATEPTVEATEPTVEPTTEPLNMKSYSVDFETATAKAQDVVATIGDVQLTNGELQVYYWMGIYEFRSANSYILPYIGVDFNQPLDQQVYDAQNGISWQEAMLDYALGTWNQHQAIRLYAESQGYELSEEGKTYEADLDKTIQEMLDTCNYESVQAMLDKEMGAGATETGYRNYWLADSYAVHYINDMRNELVLTDEELEQYYTDNQETLTASGITKEAGNTVDVRHILVQVTGGTTAEDGTVTYSDEDWENCRLAAQAIYDQWLAGDATEESFGELATEKTEDPGSKSTGGLYSGVRQGQMVPEFDSWIFDAARQYGDHGLVKTSYGYHVMYFVKSAPIWKTQCLNMYQNEKLSAIIEAAMAAAAMDVNYDAVVIGEAKTA